MALLDITPDSPAYLDRLREHFVKNLPFKSDFVWNPLEALKESRLLLEGNGTALEKFSFDYPTIDRLSKILRAQVCLTKLFQGTEDEKVCTRFATHTRYTARALCMKRLRSAVTEEYVLPYHVLVTLIVLVNPGRALPTSALATKVQDNYLPIKNRYGEIEFCRLLYNPRAITGPRWTLYPADPNQEQIPAGKVIVFGNPHV